MGVEPVNGRDIFSRVVYGGRISLLIAFLATAAVGDHRLDPGRDRRLLRRLGRQLISRVMDVFLAFPLLVFAIALAGVIPDQAFGLSGDALRIVLLVFIIGFFNWPYIGRIIRGQALSLREREFVDAARSLGARRPYILFREMLPNLMAPILVYSTLLIPTNILFEAALSFLGVGIRPPTADVGRHAQSDAVRYYTARTSCSGPAWRSSSPSWPSTSSATACATRSTPGPADRHPDAPPPCSRRGASTMRRTRTAAAMAVAAAAHLGLAACGGGSASSTRREQRLGPAATGVQRRRGQGVQPVRQEGRHPAAWRSRGDWDSLDPGDTYYGYSWDFARLYSRALTMFKAAPGQGGRRSSFRDLAAEPGQAQRRRQDLDLQAARRG